MKGKATETSKKKLGENQLDHPTQDPAATHEQWVDSWGTSSKNHKRKIKVQSEHEVHHKKLAEEPKNPREHDWSRPNQQALGSGSRTTNARNTGTQATSEDFQVVVYDPGWAQQILSRNTLETIPESGKFVVSNFHRMGKSELTAV